MSVLYVKEQGSSVQKRGERLAVVKGSETLLEVPVVSLENVAVIGNVQLTTQVLHMLLEQGVNVSYFTRYGKYIGQAAADHSKNVFLRFAQYELYQNTEERDMIARKIVANKIGNQIEMIKLHKTRNPECLKNCRKKRLPGR